MTTKSSFPSPPLPHLRVADVIYRSLETAITEQCNKRHDAHVTVERVDRTEADRPLRIRVACPGQGQITARIIIRQAGGTVYDVRCEVGEEASRRFTYSRPRGLGTALSRAPCLGRKLGTFLVGKLEQHLGRGLLSTGEQPASV